MCVVSVRAPTDPARTPHRPNSPTQPSHSTQHAFSHSPVCIIVRLAPRGDARVPIVDRRRERVEHAARQDAEGRQVDGGGQLGAQGGETGGAVGWVGERHGVGGQGREWWHDRLRCAGRPWPSPAHLKAPRRSLRVVAFSNTARDQAAKRASTRIDMTCCRWLGKLAYVWAGPRRCAPAAMHPAHPSPAPAPNPACQGCQDGVKRAPRRCRGRRALAGEPAHVFGGDDGQEAVDEGKCLRGWAGREGSGVPGGGAATRAGMPHDS